MSLDAAARRRFARQLLLGEIGEAGQERLLQAGFRSDLGCDEDAYTAAADYLRRAGCVPDETGEPVLAPDVEAVRQLAGSPALRDAAALIAGSFAAVEHLKEVLGIAAARPLPSDLKLSSEA